MNGDEALERYLGGLAARDASLHTRRSYATALAAYLAWLDDRGVDWRAPERSVLRSYLAELTDGHARTTVAQRLAAIRSFYRWAGRRGSPPATRGQRSPRPVGRAACPRS